MFWLLLKSQWSSKAHSYPYSLVLHISALTRIAWPPICSELVEIVQLFIFSIQFSINPTQNSILSQQECKFRMYVYIQNVCVYIYISKNNKIYSCFLSLLIQRKIISINTWNHSFCTSMTRTLVFSFCRARSPALFCSQFSISIVSNRDGSKLEPESCWIRRQCWVCMNGIGCDWLWQCKRIIKRPTSPQHLQVIMTHMLKVLIHSGQELRFCTQKVVLHSWGFCWWIIFVILSLRKTTGQTFW